MDEKTKKYYVGVLNDNVKDLFTIRKKLLRNNEELRLIKEFIENEHIFDYEEFALNHLDRTTEDIVSCYHLLFDVANNINYFVNTFECLVEEAKEND